MLVALWTQSAAAGPWTREPGHWYFKLGQGLFVADGFRDAQGEFNTESAYTGLSSFVYGEVGLLDRLQTQFYVPYTVGINDFDADSPRRLSTSCENGMLVQTTQRRSAGDAIAGLQWTSPWLALPHAVRANAKLPLYDLADPGGRCGDLFPQPGDGQLDASLWLSAGDSLQGAPLFVFGEVGHRFRTEVFFGEDSGQRVADTFLLFGQLGYRFMEDSFLMLNLNVSVPYTNDLTTRGALSIGPNLFLGLGEGFALETGVDFTPWARNSAQGQASSLFWTGASVGVSHTR